MSEEKGLSSQEKWSEFLTKTLELAKEAGLLGFNIGGAFLVPAEDGSERDLVQVHGNMFLPWIKNATTLYGIRDQFHAVAADAGNKAVEVALKEAEAVEQKVDAEEG